MTNLWHLPLNILQIKYLNLTSVYLELMNKHMFHSCPWAFVEPLDQHSRMNEVWWDMENTVTCGFVQKGYGCEKEKSFRCIQGSHNADCRSVHFSNLYFWKKEWVYGMWTLLICRIQISHILRCVILWTLWTKGRFLQSHDIVGASYVLWNE